MKLQNTLILSFITLILISYKANAEDVSALVSRCSDAMTAGQSEKALDAAEAALKQDGSYTEALLCKGRALATQGKYSEAQAALEQGVKTAKSGYDNGIATLLLGNLHKDNKNYMQAIANYQKSLETFKQQNYPRFIYISHMLLGETYQLNNDLNSALTTFQAASKAANNDNERADSYASLAGAHAALSQLDGAIEYQLKSTMMQKKAGTLDQYANATLQLGQYYLQAKDYKNAGATFSKLRDFAKANGGSYYEAKADLSMAQNDIDANDNDAAKLHLEEAQAIAKKLNDAELNAEIAAFMQNMKK